MFAKIGLWLAEKLALRYIPQILSFLISLVTNWKRTKKDAENEKKYKDAVKGNDDAKTSKAAEDFLNGN